ncbi:MAG TPA: PEGA domain-containing protein [Polyangia bacterium]|nr:PEGA domain-containing protein [Polyangia bacterium]
MIFVMVGGPLPWATAAKAGSEEPAEKLLRHGIELRKSGNDEQALEAFRAAYALRPTPRARAQVGLAEQALGRWVDAERDLMGAFEPPGDPWIVKNSAVLRGALAAIRHHLGSLQVVGSPAGAHVRVDDREVGVLPLARPVRVTAGQVVVSVSAPGHIEVSRKVDVVADHLAREAFTLHAEDAAAPRVETSPAAKRPAPMSRIANRAGAEEPTPPPVDGDDLTKSSEPRGTSTVRVWGVAIGAAGVLAAGVGTVFGLQAISKNNQSKVGCPMDVCVDPVRQSASRQERMQAWTDGNRATVAFVVGGVLLATGATMFVLGGASEPRAVALQVTPVAGPGQVGLVGVGRF